MSDHANKLRSITEKPHYLGSYERDALREAAGHIERQAERIAELEAELAADAKARNFHAETAALNGEQE